MHLTITSRPAKLGKSINTRVEMHGEQQVAALDIPLAGILFNDTELNALLEDPKAHSSLFVAGPGGDKVPRFTTVDSLKLSTRFAECHAELRLGIGDPLLLEDVRVAGVVLTPLRGGMTELVCKVQCTPDLAVAPRLLERMGAHIDALIGLGEAKRPEDSKQESLPLPTKVA